MHPDSIFSLSPDVLRRLDRLPYPLLLGPADHHRVVTPLSFVLNKIWTFSAVRGKNSVADDRQRRKTLKQRASDCWRLSDGQTANRLTRPRRPGSLALPLG